ncbi:N-acetylglucosamine-6-sulfatase [Fulvitalea axinellae]|uniref:N-acetylglucosamine-6-sulfatase n=1 Tax=Fulvitalea axinellae TaxID=1182444 RepID=A0AAU9DCK8_9BACT|nr:N-acetylglucosamine-6-sulfatase [Fulvitalea axinellae]
MKRVSRLLCQWAGVGLALGACSSKDNRQAEEVTKKKPNILFIMSDDHAYQAVSAYGHGINKTPNIDRIADEGAIFNNSFVTNSICGPSRAVMLTGKYSHQNGFYANYVSVFDGKQQTLPKILKGAGYTTAVVGKWHLGSDPTGFDYWNILSGAGGQGDYYNPDFNEMGKEKIIDGYVTDITTDLALNWLEKRDQEKPFMLMLHQKAPHRNWMPRLDQLGKIKEGSAKLPSNFHDDYEGRGRAAREGQMEIKSIMRWGHDMKFTTQPNGEPCRPDFIRELNRMKPEERAKWDEYYTPIMEGFNKKPLEGKALAEWKFQRYMHDYLNTVTTVDENVGRVLDYLDKKGLSDNTIVVYTSDQGFYLGEHGWFDKRFMYEQSLRMPLMVRYPKHIKPGTKVDDMVMNLDFMPTFLDYAGVDVPSDVQGASFKQVVEGKTPKTWRKSIYYHYYHYPGTHMVKRHYGVRTDRYKLIRFYHDNDEWEMYDLEKDPQEMTSVYGDPAYAEVQAEMMKVLAENQKKYGDDEQTSKRLFDQEQINHTERVKKLHADAKKK